MIGIVVVTHANLAQELCNAAKLILGPVEGLESICIDRHQSPEDAGSRLAVTLDIIGAEQGVLILTDLFGGTPTNISAEFLAAGKVDIVTGVNLPMLIKAITSRTSHSLTELAVMIKDYGSQAIIRPAQLLFGDEG